MNTVKSGSFLWLAVALVIGAYTAAQTPAHAAMKAAGKPVAAAAAARAVAWPEAAVADPTTLGFTKAGLDALDARMKQSIADGDTAGMTIILLRHGQVADFKSFGQRTPDKAMAPDSLFRIYSMSKPITGVAMMQLYEQGRWRLDDPITKHLPEFSNLKSLTWDANGKAVTGADGQPVLTTPKKPATMRQLMSHTAGFGYGLSVGELHVGLDGTTAQSGADAVRFGLDFAIHVDPKRAGAPYGQGTFYWGGAAGTWFWVDPVNDLAFVGMIQNMGGNRPGGLNFRNDSARLVYAALAKSPARTSQP